jgi:uncharacterized protein
MMKKHLFFLLTSTLPLFNLWAQGPEKKEVNHATDKVLRFDKFQESSIIACAPQGWLLEFLKRQKSGLTGHPEVLSYPFNSCLWAGVITRVDEKHGANWWRYEQTAYYSDGVLRLGYLLNDETLIKTGRAGVEYTLDHIQKNGRLGPDFLTSQWPVAVYFRVLQAEYMSTGNPQIIEALHKHYLSYTSEEIGNAKRNIVNIEGALWTYGKTNDPKLLELAEKAYALGGFELNMKACMLPDSTILHGVTYMEMAKLPAILYTFTGKKEYLDAALSAMQKLDRYHMLPDGVPSSNEFLAGKDPLNSHETCDITDYTWAVGYLLMATGDAAWADHIEKAVFNAGPGAVSKDFKNLQYFSSVNQVIATGNSNQNKFFHGSTWMAYWPCHETECCAGNVHRFMPNYAARMWMRDANGGPVAALYGPSVERVSLNGGKNNLTITETTNYPFSDQVIFSFDMDKPVSLPFSFRIPAWCHNASVTINDKPFTGELREGTFVTIKRKFERNDKITIHLPMSAQLVKGDKGGVSVEYGPLLFAYPVPEKVTIDTSTYANLGGKKSLNPDFLALDIRPSGPWNYALAVDEHNFSGKVQMKGNVKSSYPFDPAGVPMVIRVPARKVKNWTLVDDRYTPSLPESGTMEYGATVDTIALVPYGSTRLRIAEFPTTGSAVSFPPQAAKLPYLDETLPIAQRVENALSLMTLEEKVGIVHAQSKFSSKGVPRLGIPELWTDDGPHGVRAEVLYDAWKPADWNNDSCTAFPALTCLAATWNTDISHLYGKTVGEEARYRKKDVLLGPGVNIYRTPMNGRNFEYMGEDPYLSSQMVVPYIKGVQENGIAACVKHFALNNQEERRVSINVKVSDRALHEIYLPAFKAAIQEGGALSLMAAYNKYQGNWCAENELLLKTILKKDWGFKGVVISDWDAVHNTIRAANNGVDLEMGTNVKSGSYDDYFLAKPYLKALKEGQATMDDLNDKVRRILTLLFKTAMNTNRPWGSFGSEEHMMVSRKIAEEGIVLLQNKNNVLPLDLKVIKSIAVIGENATRKMTLGGGSSSLKTKREISPLQGLKNKLGNSVKITFAQGYSHIRDSSTVALKNQAVNVAKDADVVLFLGGLSKDRYQDSEGSDRTDYNLPFGQNELIKELIAVNKKVVVVLISGNAVEMPWVSDVQGIVQEWYGGSEAGSAIANVLTGEVNPSGKLPFSFPKKLTDNSAYAMGGISNDTIDATYKEDIFVGYRYHDTYKVAPQFAFGHGLSYTTFQYDNMMVQKEGENVIVNITVKNTGKVPGAEIVQLYVTKENSQVKRPAKELKAFRKVFLKEGESTRMSFTLPKEAFQYYDETARQWIVEPGAYQLSAGAASDDIRLVKGIVL